MRRCNYRNRLNLFNCFQYWSLNNKLKIDYNIINSKIQLIPFLLSLDKTKMLLLLNNNYYNTSSLIIKNHINASLNIFEVESQKRYKKFQPYI